MTKGTVLFVIAVPWAEDVCDKKNRPYCHPTVSPRRRSGEDNSLSLERTEGE